MKPQWHDYTPKLDVWSGGTTPNLGGADRTQVGRYLFLPDSKLVVYDFILVFGTGGTAGSGNYIVSLPVPARVGMGGTGSGGANNDQHDRPLGSAFISRLFQSNGITVYPNISDTGPTGTAGARRGRWMQFFSPWQIAAGSNTIASGSTTRAVTFPQTLVTAPTAADIIIGFTSSTTTDPGNTWITGLSTTGFTLNVRTNPGAGGLAFDWKVRQESPVIVSDQSPWAWGTLGDGIYGTATYEAAISG